ncbi:MAG: hypothetical protein ABJ275_10530 [Maricaulaceae bacterium]
MKKIILICSALSLSACATTMTAAPLGANSFNKSATTVSLTQGWTSVPDALHLATGTVLTKDGMSLNRLHILTVAEDKTMVDKLDKSSEYPIFTAGMSKIQQIDFVKSSLLRTGIDEINTANVTPAQVSGLSGVTFDMDGKYSSGLNMKGRVTMAESSAGLNVIAFIAPKEYYYDRDIGEVNNIIETLQFPQ